MSKKMKSLEEMNVDEINERLNALAEEKKAAMKAKRKAEKEEARRRKEEELLKLQAEKDALYEWSKSKTLKDGRTVFEVFKNETREASSEEKSVEQNAQSFVSDDVNSMATAY